ncbi:MAG: lipopolysaccharide biosynthesis protein [Thermoguttaceae bacterium]|nr:lipopolysaccharide biosynthesis protein [Thermoguttaceae bacterium]
MRLLWRVPVLLAGSCEVVWWKQTLRTAARPEFPLRDAPPRFSRNQKVDVLSNTLEIEGARGGCSGTAAPAVYAAMEPRLRPLTLGRNFSWIVAGNAAAGLSRWGIFVVLAQIGGLGMVGEVVLAFAITTPMVALANLGLRSAQVTDVNDQYRFGDYLGLRLLSIAVFLLVTAGVVIWNGSESRMAWLVMITAFGKAFESASDVFHGLMQQYERMDRIGIALIIQGPLGLALLAVGSLLTGSPVGGMAGLAVALAATLVLFEIPNGYRVLRWNSVRPRRPREAICEMLPCWNPRKLARLAWITVPLGVVASLTALSPNLPRYAVEEELGKHALGVFAAIVALASLGTMVTTALGQSSIARLARHHVRGERRAYWKLLALLLAGAAAPGLVLTGVMAVAADQVLGFLYGPELVGHRGLAVLLMIGMTLQQVAGPLGRGIESMRRFHTQMLIRLATVLLLLAVLPPLVGSYGLHGAAAGLLLSGTATVAFHGLAIWISMRSPADRIGERGGRLQDRFRAANELG